jgi:hypothetical protein
MTAEVTYTTTDGAAHRETVDVGPLPTIPIVAAAGYDPAILHDIATYITTIAINGQQGIHAKRMYDWALHLDPDNAGALTALANIASEAKNYDEAHALYRRAVKLAPGDPDAMINMAAVSQHCGELESSLEWVNQALAAEPDNLRGWRQKAYTLRDLERYDDSQDAITEGMKVGPGDMPLMEMRAFNHFQVGEWEQGWSNWEMRFSRQQFSLALQPPAPPEWDGGDPAGKKILVICEHGIGDKIMFARWVPILRDRGALVTVGTPPTLTRLFQAALPGCEVATDPNPYPYDCWVGMNSLPLRLGVFAPPAPMDLRSIRGLSWHGTDAGASRLWRRSGSPLRVGVCWHGAQTTPVEHMRPTDLELWLTLFDVAFRSDDRIRFLNLQFGEDEKLKEFLTCGRDDSPEYFEPLGKPTDMLDTAVRMADLDLVITADVSICHLAASMGKPTWMLLYRPPEWRWGTGGERTPWYPSMRIFRQEKRGEWAPVFERVAEELEAML